MAKQTKMTPGVIAATIVGLALVIFPEPASTATGLLILGGTFVATKKGK
jgi:hypothetical protein